MDQPRVTTANFVRAETNRMFATLSGVTGGLSTFMHTRRPTAIDQQNVIRMNRDTLYSIAICDLDGDVSITLPDARGRYLSLMVLDQDHYVGALLHDAGTHVLNPADFGSRYVALVVRILVDPTDTDDLAQVNALQDEVLLECGATGTFEAPRYDKESFKAVRQAVLELAKWTPGFEGGFGRRGEVDPVQHLIGTAAGWGGLPPAEATYLGVNPQMPVGHYILEVPRGVPVDAFWSISVYNEAGFFEQNDLEQYSVNSVTATQEADGTTVVHLGGPGDLPNSIWLPEGWNYVVRLYRPHPEILDGSWRFPRFRQA